MTVTIGAVSTNWAKPLKRKIQNGTPVHEIAGANDAYVQDTGRMNEDYSYELLLETADRATLKGYAEDSTTIASLTDDVAGITAQNVKINSFVEDEEVPGLWRVQVRLVKKPL